MTELLNSDIDPQLLSRLQEIIPDLRRDLEHSVRARMQTQLEHAKHQHRQKTKLHYEHALKASIDQTNATIRHSLSSLIDQIDQARTRPKTKGMNADEEKDFVEQTVQEILSDQAMVREIRERVRGRVEGRVRGMMEREVEEAVEAGRREAAERARTERERWTEDRIAHWRRQSDLRLQELAAEHSDLNAKKMSIQASLSGRRMELSQVEQRLQQIQQKNALVASLRKEVQQLQEKKRAN